MAAGNFNLGASAALVQEAVDRAIASVPREQIAEIAETVQRELEDLEEANTRTLLPSRLERYLTEQPKIYFVTEYVVDGKFIGLLVAFERFLISTHYEIYKKNWFHANPAPERILFLTKAALEAETVYYVDYVKNTLGFNTLNENNVFIVLDTIIKKERIYEYDVRASFVPQAASEIDYSFILRSKNLMKQVDVVSDSNLNLFSFAFSTLGKTNKGWIIGLLNNVPYFGRAAASLALSSIETVQNAPYVYMPSSEQDLLTAINDSVSLFGFKSTLQHMVDVLGGKSFKALSVVRSLNEEVQNAFDLSIDESQGYFSIDVFKTQMNDISTSFKLALEKASLVASTFGTASALTGVVELGTMTGTRSFNSIDDLSDIFEVLRKTELAIMYVHENLDLFTLTAEQTQAVQEEQAQVDAATTEVEDEVLMISVEEPIVGVLVEPARSVNLPDRATSAPPPTSGAPNAIGVTLTGNAGGSSTSAGSGGFSNTQAGGANSTGLTLTGAAGGTSSTSSGLTSTASGMTATEEQVIAEVVPVVAGGYARVVEPLPTATSAPTSTGTRRSVPDRRGR